MQPIYDNKEAFLRLKPKKLFIICIISFLLLIILLFISAKIKVYNHYITKGYVECSEECTINVTIPSDLDYQKIELNNKNWQGKLLQKSLEIDQENMLSYYHLTFENDQNLLNQEIVSLHFYYHKQSILQKIIELVF